MTAHSIYTIIATLQNALRNISHCKHYLTNAGLNIHLNRQWYDLRDLCNQPAISLFILEETPQEHKNNHYKQELTIHIEGFLILHRVEDIYHLISDTKRALLKEPFTFNLIYQGYEITLPEEGAKIARVQLKFKASYIETIE